MDVYLYSYSCSSQIYGAPSVFYSVSSEINIIYLRNKETQQTLWVTKNMLCNASMWYNWAYYMKAISKR